MNMIYITLSILNVSWKRWVFLENWLLFPLRYFPIENVPLNLDKILGQFQIILFQTIVLPNLHTHLLEINLPDLNLNNLTAPTILKTLKSYLQQNTIITIKHVKILNLFVEIFPRCGVYKFTFIKIWI